MWTNGGCESSFPLSLGAPRPIYRDENGTTIHDVDFKNLRMALRDGCMQGHFDITEMQGLPFMELRPIWGRSRRLSVMKMFRDRFNIPLIVDLSNQSKFHAICIEGCNVPRSMTGTYAVQGTQEEVKGHENELEENDELQQLYNADTEAETEELQNESLQQDLTPDAVYRSNRCAASTIAVNICLTVTGQHYEYIPKMNQPRNVLDSILSRPEGEVHVNNARSNAAQDWLDLHLKFAHKSYTDLEYMRRYKLVRGLEKLPPLNLSLIHI